jgi:cysteine-rich repeat protein
MKARRLLVAFLTTGLCIAGGRAAYAQNLCTGGVPDGTLQGAEQCDDGNNVNSDNCTNNCRIPACDDGVIHTTGVCSINTTITCATAANCPAVPAQTCNFAGVGPETCDAATFGGPLPPNCNPATCVASVCGDGNITFGEQCDGANLGGADCSAHGGNGTVSCSATCQLVFTACGSCGDGTVNPPQEMCDPPFSAVCNGGPNDGTACTVGDDSPCIDVNNPTGPQGTCGKNVGCNTICQDNLCGDTVVNTGAGEQCDLGVRTCSSSGPANGKECGTVNGKAACDADVGSQCLPLGGNDDYDADRCRTNCRNAYCGDGVADAGELCDDGFASGMDVPPVGTAPGRGAIDDADNCPNGFVTAATPAGPGKAACHTYNVCGDGIPQLVDSSARCHDGGLFASCGGTDPCTTTPTACDGGGGNTFLCVGPFPFVTVPGAALRCRNNIGKACTVDADCGAGDTCGPSNTQPNHCRTTCVNPSCGDDVTDTGEGCDEGKAICVSTGTHNGQPCGTPASIAACATDPTPSCLHDGTGANCNANATDAVPGACNTDLTDTTCRTNCATPQCGDGIVEAGEQCDHGASNGVPPDTCTATCQNNVCGDGYMGGTEQCDNGVNNNNDADCLPTCQKASCGDGHLDSVGPNDKELCDPTVAPGTPANCPACCPTSTGLVLSTDADRFAAAECSLAIYQADMIATPPTGVGTNLQKPLQHFIDAAAKAEGIAKSTPKRLCSKLKTAAKKMTSSDKKLDSYALRGQILVVTQTSLKSDISAPLGWYGNIRNVHACK